MRICGGADPNFGLFNATYSAIAQLTWRPSPNFGIGATYLHADAALGRCGFNNLGLTLTGTAVANTLAGQVSIADATGFGPFNRQPVVTMSSPPASFGSRLLTKIRVTATR